MGECARVHERLPRRSPYRFPPAPPTCWHFNNCSKKLLWVNTSLELWHFISLAFYFKWALHDIKHQTSAASPVPFGADLEDGLRSGSLHHTNDSKAVPKLTRVVLGESASSSDRHRDSLLLLEHTSLAGPPGPSDTLLFQSRPGEKPCFQYGEPNPIRGEPLEC